MSLRLSSGYKTRSCLNTYPTQKREKKELQRKAINHELVGIAKMNTGLEKKNGNSKWSLNPWFVASHNVSTPAALNSTCVVYDVTPPTP